MLTRLVARTSISLLATLGLVVPLGSTGCDVCFGECVGDGGAGSSEDGGQATTGVGITSTSGATSVGSDTDAGDTEPWEATSVASETDPWEATSVAPETDSWGGATNGEGETEGLGCGGTTPPPDVVDMKVVRAGDMDPPPAAYSADTRFLVVRSQGSVCGPDPLAPPDCAQAEEFTLVVVLPPEFQAVGMYEFGDYASETGFEEAELESWIHIGGTASCETGVIPDSAYLIIDTIETDGSITGQICNFYWMPGLGQGLSGYIDAPSC